MIKILKTLSLIILSHGIIHADLQIPDKAAQIVVFTDYEADDSVALALFMKYLKDHKISNENDFLVVTSLSNQYRKKALAQILVKSFGYNESCVVAGTGGIKEPFEEEGRNILSGESYNKFLENDITYIASKDPKMHRDPKFSKCFKKKLEKAKPNSVDVIILTNPIDFIDTISSSEKLINKINNIYMMGGWFGNKPSFNWNMYINSIEKLLHLMEKAKKLFHAPKLFILSSN